MKFLMEIKFDEETRLYEGKAELKYSVKLNRSDKLVDKSVDFHITGYSRLTVLKRIEDDLQVFLERNGFSVM